MNKIKGKTCEIDVDRTVNKVTSQTWFVATMSVMVISGVSAVGAVTIPLMRYRTHYNRFMSGLVAMAVGTMVGDAVLHLLPHAQMSAGHHNHDHSSIYKNLVAVIGVYLFFLFETSMSFFRKENKENEDQNVEAPQNKKFKAEGNEKCVDRDCSSNALLSVHKEGVTATSSEQSFDDASEEITSVQVEVPVKKIEQQTSVLKMAYMIIVGDGLHNFSDGLAIGAAFSGGMGAGLSTCLAIFLHELPQELGDFALLLRSGMKIKKAILFNLLSGLLAVFGTFIGLAIGEYTYNFKLWILALTAGGFLYVSLTDMLPTLVAEAGTRKNGFFGFIIIQIGFLFGVSTMLIIAFNEFE